MLGVERARISPPSGWREFFVSRSSKATRVSGGRPDDPYAGRNTSDSDPDSLGWELSNVAQREKCMSKELIVSTGKHETRVAILEDDQLVEIFHEREKEYSLAGSIHKGRVTRVLPGMQSAFVDIGLERDAFLYVSDFFEDNEEYEAVVSTVEDKVLKMDREKTEREDRGRGPEKIERDRPERGRPEA